MGRNDTVCTLCLVFSCTPFSPLIAQFSLAKPSFSNASFILPAPLGISSEIQIYVLAVPSLSAWSLCLLCGFLLSIFLNISQILSLLFTLKYESWTYYLIFQCCLFYLFTADVFSQVCSRVSLCLEKKYWLQLSVALFHCLRLLHPNIFRCLSSGAYSCYCTWQNYPPFRHTSYEIQS